MGHRAIFAYAKSSGTARVVLSLLFGLAACDSSSSGSNEPGEIPEQCEHLDEIAVGPYFLQNNKWGSPKSGSYVQCIRRSAPAPFPVSWRWSSSGELSDSVQGYPFLGFGQDPWRPSSTVVGFPHTLGSIRNLSVSHTVRSQATGKYNLAFDIWITREPGVTTPPESNITRELMIWLEYSENPLPPGWLVAEVTLGGEAYDFYRAPNEPTASYVRDYLAFLKKAPGISGTTPIHEFVEYLLARGYALPEEHLRNVFLGNEVWDGTGTTVVDDYAFELSD
jgi:hypothetical protein